MTKLYGAALAAAKSKYNRVLVAKKAAVEAALQEYRQEHYRILSELAKDEACPDKAAVLLALAEHAVAAEPIYGRLSPQNEVWTCELQREPSLEGIANKLFGFETPRPSSSLLACAINELEAWEKKSTLLA